MRNLAPNIKQIQIALLFKTVVLADQSTFISGLFPQLEGVGRITWHQGLVSPSPMGMGELRCPK